MDVFFFKPPRPPSNAPRNSKNPFRCGDLEEVTVKHLFEFLLDVISFRAWTASLFSVQTDAYPISTRSIRMKLDDFSTARNFTSRHASELNLDSF